MRKLWTNEEVQYLKDNYKSEESITHLMEVLNRSKASIQHKASRLKIKVRNGKPRKRKIGDSYYWYKCINREPRFIHQILAEKMLGRPLDSDEVVHHKDGNKLNNKMSNLEVLTKSEHMKKHYKDRSINSKGQFC